MSYQQTQLRKKYIEKPIQRITGSPGSYWIQSEKHKQLWYKVVLRVENNQIYCACQDFKSRQGQLCKHIFKVMSLETAIEI